ncbi:uncharacterized protein LOC141766204 isoform X2 [Sebastes fasciatus]|uniref:uncharacterized protein LOC141766204 isoform X2 n=2 Tax=Sebastes fasciatus TaxID=394691 RepID=UPI003D9DF15A
MSGNDTEEPMDCSEGSDDQQPSTFLKSTEMPSGAPEDTEGHQRTPEDTEPLMTSSKKKDEEVQVALSVWWSKGVHPQKYKSELQKVLQIWFSNNKEFKGDCTVLDAKDGSAVVRLKPLPAASELQKLIGQTLTKKYKKVVKILSVSVTLLETQIPEDAPMNLPPSYVSEPQDEQVQLGEQSSAASTAGEETCSVPVAHFWYLNHIYKEEMNRIEKENGVKMEAEVKVTFQADRKDAGPQKALNEFISLVQKSLGESDGSLIPLKNVDPEEWKDVLKIAQTKENKLLLTVSSEEMTACGPMQSQDAIKKSLHAAISTSTSVGESTWASQDTKLNTSIKDPLVSTGLAMEESYWKLMTTSFSEQNKDEVQVTLSVKWSEGVQLQKYKTELEKVLQSWANNNKEFDGDCTVLSVSEDVSAVVHFKPAPAVCVLQKLCGQTLTKKDKKVVTILSVSLTPLETQVPEDAPMNLPPSYVSEPQDEQVQLGQQSSAASTAGEDTCSVPVGLFWYANHIYKEEIKRIVKDNGVKMEAEVKVTFQADRKDAGPQKALSEFINLVQKCLGESDGSPIPLKNVDPKEWKDVLKIAQTKENKLLLTVSSEEMTACGPMQSQDAIKKSLHAAISTSTSVGESTWASQDTMLNIGTNIKDPLVSTGLTMEESYWKLMTTSFSEQVAKIKTKFGVDFKESGVSQGKVKVKACYKSSGGNVSMESHAVRALLHLYQKTATVNMPSKSP